MKENIIIQIHGGEKEISHIKNMAKKRMESCWQPSQRYQIT